MLDINLIRQNPTAVEENLAKRQNPENIALLKDLIKNDKEWRAFKQEADALRQKRNQLSNVKAKKIKRSDGRVDVIVKAPALKLKLEAKEISVKIKDIEAKMAKFEEKNTLCLMRLPNLLDKSVPFGKDDSENVVVKKGGAPKKPAFPLKHHGELAVELDIADFERAVKISGNGFFYLKGSLVMIDLALQHYALDILSKKGFIPVQPPFLMRRKPYEGVVSLEDFESVMYKAEDEDLYLIATSEHPLAAMYQNEILDEKDLPIKYAGLSPCFRKEIGKHGLDERGFFRVHQFNKIEQLVFCTPEQSEKLFEEIAMLRHCLKGSKFLLKKSMFAPVILEALLPKNMILTAGLQEKESISS